jgi:hypothetical protein
MTSSVPSNNGMQLTKRGLLACAHAGETRARVVIGARSQLIPVLDGHEDRKALMARRIAWKRWAVASMIHFTFAVAAFGVALTSLYTWIDGEPKPGPTSLRVAGFLSDVLASPYRQLWAMLQPQGTHLPEWLQPLLFASNSVLWGGVLSAIIGLARGKQPNGHA